MSYIIQIQTERFKENLFFKCKKSQGHLYWFTPVLLDLTVLHSAKQIFVEQNGNHLPLILNENKISSLCGMLGHTAIASHGHRPFLQGAMPYPNVPLTEIAGA